MLLFYINCRPISRPKPKRQHPQPIKSFLKPNHLNAFNMRTLPPIQYWSPFNISSYWTSEVWDTLVQNINAYAADQEETHCNTLAGQ